MMYNDKFGIPTCRLILRTTLSLVVTMLGVSLYGWLEVLHHHPAGPGEAVVVFNHMVTSEAQTQV